MKLKKIKLDDYKDHPKNPNTHPDGQIIELVSSLDEFSQVKNIVIWKGFYLAGHGLVQAARAKGLNTLMAVDVSDWAEDKAVKFMVADNRLPELSIIDDGMLLDILKDFEDPTSVPGVDDSFFRDLGFEQPGAVAPGVDSKRGLVSENGGGIENPTAEQKDYIRHEDVGSMVGALARDFLIPPFSILDARSGNWIARKRLWIKLGIKSEAGREHVKILPKQGMRGEELKQVSIFDPVLCEIIYRWFCGVGGRILDPFAGGSVRGIVAAKLGCDYVGIDLSAQQVAENIKQWKIIKKLKTEAPSSRFVASGLTPVEFLPEAGIHLKRDDLFYCAGVRGGKVRTALALSEKSGGLVTAGSRSSPQVLIIGYLARHLGVPCRLHVPSGKLPQEMIDLDKSVEGCEFVQHKPGYNTVIIKRARDDAEKMGWTNIPFGMECDEAVKQTSAQVENLPRDVKRIVMPVGSGMSLAGVLQGLIKFGRDDVRVKGICVGADPVKRLDQYAPPAWRDMVLLVKCELDYHDKGGKRDIEGVEVDPIYEAKCLPYLEKGDLFWIVGLRGLFEEDEESALTPCTQGDVAWVVGDSLNLGACVRGKFDFIFSCPPYADLEVYSDDARDISYMGYEQFLKTYFTIIDRAVSKLNNNRFACFVVGDLRDAQGFYQEFIYHTITAFRRAGAKLYNDAIIINSYTSLPMRTRRPFVRSRKLGKAHQNVLVFCKGDPHKATAWVEGANAAAGLGVAAGAADEMNGSSG